METTKYLHRAERSAKSHLGLGGSLCLLSFICGALASIHALALGNYFTPLSFSSEFKTLSILFVFYESWS